MVLIEVGWMIFEIVVLPDFIQYFLDASCYLNVISFEFSKVFWVVLFGDRENKFRGAGFF